MALAAQVKLDRYQENQLGLWDGDLCITDRVSDEMLAMAYMQFKMEGLLGDIYHESVPSLSWFVEHFTKARGVEVLSITKRIRDGSMVTCGLGWLNSRTNVGGAFTKMEVGYAFFEKHHALRTTIPATRLAIEFAFRFLGIESMFGTTPEHNRGALAVARRVGFTLHGPIPHFSVWKGKPCAVWISSMNKNQWEQLKESQ